MSEGKGKDSAGKPEASAAAGGRAPIGLLALTWLVPGLGHWVLGRRTRAVVFCAVIVAGFITGVALDGELGIPKSGSPFSWLAAFACVGNGVLYALRLLWVNGLTLLSSEVPFGLGGGGDPMAVGFSYGNTFLYTSGLMNLLAVLDVSDIARGAKD